MKSDLELKSDIDAELAWDPAVNPANVGVAVKDGVVTLSGTVDSYVQKHAVERAVRRVAGVRGIAVQLEVRLAPDHHRTDAEIAQAALHALRWQSLVPEERVKVEVEHGWVTLTGDVDWGYQSASAEQALQPLVGVRGVTNQIRIAQHVNPKDIRADIAAALTRHAQREASRIGVEVEAGIVTLSGKVDSLAERDAAMGTAFAAKGVRQVVDRIEVIA
jgi:osmotically-inducible protein OsmY